MSAGLEFMGASKHGSQYRGRCITERTAGHFATYSRMSQHRTSRQTETRAITQTAGKQPVNTAGHFGNRWRLLQRTQDSNGKTVSSRSSPHVRQHDTMVHHVPVRAALRRRQQLGQLSYGLATSHQS